MRKTVLLLLLASIITLAKAQDIPVHSNNSGIYEFLDEMAAYGYINPNAAVKPYSAKFIYTCLEEANRSIELLTKRQRKELNFYLRQYSIFADGNENPYTKDRKGNIITRERLNLGFYPYGLHYKDSLFAFSIRPIWGIREYTGGADNIMHTWGGAEAWGYVGRFAIYGSLRDNYQTEILAKPTYFTQSEGGNYKVNVQGREGGDYSEMRGGVTYNWRWGSIGLVKDHVQWGTNYHGSTILSGRTPSFGMIKLQMKPVDWFELNYIHGWLISEVVDSSRSYTTSNGDFRAVYRDKYIAANLLTFYPFRGIGLSVGNSIVYSDSHIQPAYLIPIMFYKSIDHTLNHNIDNQNSQMFIDLSIRRIKDLHLYGTIFIDEFSVTRVSDPDRQNFLSFKGGARLSNWPIPNVTLTAEYTRVNPIVYKHRVETTTFETNKFNLGYYLRDNSEEIYLAAEAKPFRGFTIKGEFFVAKHGNEYAYTDGNEAELLPYMQDVTWKNTTMSLTTRWEFIHDSWLFLSVTNSDIKGYDVDGKTAQYYLDLYTPKSFQGKNTIICAGLNFGF
ncbi:MAG: hypothetical protein AB7S48_11345 [Bacteroidales bacterium]